MTHELGRRSSHCKSACAKASLTSKLKELRSLANVRRSSPAIREVPVRSVATMSTANMTFKISKLEETDIDAMIEVDDLAMKGWPVAEAMHLQAQRDGHSGRKAMLKAWMRKAFEAHNANGVWLKATSDETGQLVAAACWTWHLEEATMDKPANTSGTRDAKIDTVWAAMRKDQEEFQEAYFANAKRYRTRCLSALLQPRRLPIIDLQVLVTHPDWQRHGAGSMLVKYGCDKADEAGVISTLVATEAGHGLYLKNGFRVVREKSLDLRPFGVDAFELRRWMVRSPNGLPLRVQ